MTEPPLCCGETMVLQDWAEARTTQNHIPGPTQNPHGQSMRDSWRPAWNYEITSTIWECGRCKIKLARPEKYTRIS